MPESIEHFGLPPSIVEMIRGVFARYAPLAEVRVYGSRAKGNYRPGSDIDLCIMNEHVSNAQLTQIESALDELPTLYSIDLSRFRQIDNPALTEHILRVGKIFYSTNRPG